MIVEILLGTFVFAGLVIKMTQRPKNFPPGTLRICLYCLLVFKLRFPKYILGPRGLPIVGYAPFLAKNDPSGYIYKSLANLSKIYGPVVGFFMGPTKPVISVCGYEAVKEALQNPDLDGRVDTETIKIRSFGERLGKSSLHNRTKMIVVILFC